MKIRLPRPRQARLDHRLSPHSHPGKEGPRRFFKTVIKQDAKPNLVNIDQNEVNTSGIQQVNREHHTRIKIGQCK